MAPVVWTALGFGSYLLVLAALAVRASRTAGRSETDFYLAGRTLGPWVVALSAVASGRSAWLILSVSWMAYANGVSAVWVLPGYILVELLLFVGPGRRLRRATGIREDVTVGDYFASRFPDTGRVLQAVFALTVILFLTVYVSAQLVGGAKGMDRAFAEGTRSWETPGLLATGGIVLVYVVVGGFRAVSWTDVAQVALMGLALVVLPFVAVLQFGGVGSVLEALGDAADPLARGWPAVLVGLSIGFGSPGNPHILVRYMSVSDERRLKRAALVGTAWNVLMGWGALWIGLTARALAESGNAIYTGLDKEYVFQTLALHHFHPLLFGLVIAALLAAIMSTVDSQVLVVASAFTRDLRRAFGLRALAARRAATLARVVSALLVLAALGLGLHLLGHVREGTQGGLITGLVNELVLFAWGGLGAAFGPAILLSLYRRRFSGTAALASMLTGGLAAYAWKWHVAPAVKALDPVPAWWPYLQYELTVAFPLALLVGWGVAALAARREAAPKAG